MVCSRCVKVVRTELQENGIDIINVELGKMSYRENGNKDLSIINEVLEQNDFEIIASQEDILTENIKHKLIELLNELPIKDNKVLSKYLSDILNTDYSKISKVFSYTTGKTIEQYFINLKIEKVKELIQSSQYNFTEISQLIGYSSVGNLSAQFKKHTGKSLTEYKNMNKNFRKSLDKI